ncbi:MAG: translation initiation factor IF-3 [Chitinophagales bacterium]|nr:translation initiation factor IF-3 [Chitinophagales bacterium]MDW8393221.1 translation initiation factor IF-3 [Chitinophagales bacterium]
MSFSLRRPPRKEPEHRINHMITAPQVRLVGDNVVNSIYSIREARRLAEELGVDLVEIAPTANPPVCRLVDYNKFLYDKKKKEKEIKARQVKQVTKEIRFTPNTDDHDFEFKSRHAQKFLQEGAKVKAYVHFRGRMIAFKDRGELLLLQFMDRLKDYGRSEGDLRMEGNRMWVVLTPKPKK